MNNSQLEEQLSCDLKISKQLKPSIVSLRTINPIRQIVDTLVIPPNATKSFISLALGDPTLFGNLRIPVACLDSITTHLHSYKANGYGPSIGLLSARQAIAKMYTHKDAVITAKDVVVTSGCSDALNICIGVLCDEGTNILLPRPGFSLYETLASSKGVECRFYDLVAERSWEADLEMMEALVDDKTRAILVNNPSNPCGSVYSKEHLLDIIAFARRHNLPLIADEIYADMVFKGQTFYSMASLSQDVPVLTCGGIAKRYLVPGWRVGWIYVYDPTSVLDKIREGIVNLSQLIIGANSLVQASVADILDSPQSFHDDTMSQLELNADLSVSILSQVKGLKVVIPQGAMYVMVEILIDQFKGFNSDVEFVNKLVEEENVLCLPGKCFRAKGAFVRIVFSSPKEVLEDAFRRIKSFCERHQI